VILARVEGRSMGGEGEGRRRRGSRSVGLAPTPGWDELFFSGLVSQSGDEGNVGSPLSPFSLFSSEAFF
jgi:hypothetical protein